MAEAKDFTVKNLSPVWKEQILIIDDTLPIAEFLRKLFSDVGKVETAENGKEGLQKVREKYFDVIISDVRMPVMDGIEFYKLASAHDPQIARRILFYSAETHPDHIDFFRVNNLQYLRKPASISEIMRKVSEIIPRQMRNVPMQP